MMLSFFALLGLFAVYLIAWASGFGAGHRAGWKALASQRKEVERILAECEEVKAQYDRVKETVDENAKRALRTVAQAEEFLTSVRDRTKGA